MSNETTPTTIKLSISQIYAAIEYWLNTKVFREGVKVQSVTWKNNNEFEITFSSEAEPGTMLIGGSSK